MRARVQIPLTPPKNTTTHPVVVFFNEEWDLKGRPREFENPLLHTQYKKYAKNEYFLIFVLTFCQKHGILQQVERNIVNR